MNFNCIKVYLKGICVNYFRAIHVNIVSDNICIYFLSPSFSVPVIVAINKIDKPDCDIVSTELNFKKNPY